MEWSEQFYAKTLPDALALLNQLAPKLQALAVTDQITQTGPETMSVLSDLLRHLNGRGQGEPGRGSKT
ncbi:hypothetical protein ACQEVM_38250 [Streptomyces sp. CA-243310]|uniref:hypothetical protein n=1 Tax=Streptomyces sp. CA-243310 TaxID=3240056 RepID=UPI003D93015D